MSQRAWLKARGSPRVAVVPAILRTADTSNPRSSSVYTTECRSRRKIFGPVLVVIPHDGDDLAVDIADNSTYGLGGAVFTEDPAGGFAVARKVRTGSFGVSGYMPDFGAPAGGFKASGLGREFGLKALNAIERLSRSTQWLCRLKRSRSGHDLRNLAHERVGTHPVRRDSLGIDVAVAADRIWQLYAHPIIRQYLLNYVVILA